MFTWCLICCNFLFTATDYYNSAEQEVERIVLVLPLCVLPPTPFSVGKLPFWQSQKGFGQRTWGLHTQAHADMSTCSSLSLAYLMLPIGRGSSRQQLPLHTRGPRMKFIYSSHRLLLSPLVFIWIYSASFDSFSLRSPFLLLRYASLAQWTPLPIATQHWQTDCTPLGAGGWFYKLNWTQKQLKTRAKKMDLFWMLGLLWKPIFLYTQQLQQRLESRRCGEVPGLIIPLPC